MATTQIKKSLALPGTFEPNALYMIQNGSDKAVLYIANSAGTAIRALFSPSQQAQIDAIVTPTAQASTIASGAWNGFRNRIINPRGLVDEVLRNAITTSNSVGTYLWCADRWRVATAAGANIKAGAVKLGTPPLNWMYSEILSPKASVAATDQLRIYQLIEGLNIADLNSGSIFSESVIITFKTCHSIAGKYSLALYNGGLNRSYVTTYTQNVANVAEEKSVTVRLDTTGTWLTDTGVGIGVSFDYGSGTNFHTANTGVWQAGYYLRTADSVSPVSVNGAITRITDVQFALAGTSPLLEFRPFSVELALCQRYFESIATNQIGVFNDTNAPSAEGITVPVYWKVRKRVTPTLYFQTGTVGRVGADGATLYQQGTPARNWYYPGFIEGYADLY